MKVDLLLLITCLFWHYTWRTRTRSQRLQNSKKSFIMEKEILKRWHFCSKSWNILVQKLQIFQNFFRKFSDSGPAGPARAGPKFSGPAPPRAGPGLFPKRPGLKLRPESHPWLWGMVLINLVQVLNWSNIFLHG